MGTVYAIEATLQVNRKKAPGDTLREALAKEILAQADKGVGFGPDFSYEKLETLRGCLDLVFVEHQHMYDYKEEGNENEYTVYVNSGFDASYGWAFVMLDCFKAIVPLLEDGSELYIDNEHWVVENGLMIKTIINLPKSMDVPMPDPPIDESEMEDYINDQLSDRTGWCVNSYNYCTTRNTIHVTNIDWDTSD